MTRINCVPPSELCRQHLIAEYRELPRVFKQARRAWDNGLDLKIPHTYRLGVGHVRFFYDKMSYLRRRHATLCDEMKRRGYRTNICCDDMGFDVPIYMQCDWTPTKEAMKVNRKRIQKRLEHLNSG